MAARVHMGERTLALGAVAGLVAGIPFALWMMVYSAATANGFATPFNVCWAFFVYRSDAQRMLTDAMMHPGMMMDAPVQTSHVLVGGLLHFGFSAVTGAAFAAVLLFAIRTLRLPALRTWLGFTAASLIGGILLYLLMVYAILPWANPFIVDMTPRGTFFTAHVIYGLVFGVTAFALIRPDRLAVAAAPTPRPA
ncbi:MAG TPA: hypothetical protein VMU65_13855 [Candidatus Saccharimonadales bacterium]|nr:hypothetical protein [Candidatus Saccharimonadales bacterium]